MTGKSFRKTFLKSVKMRQYCYDVPGTNNFHFKLRNFWTRMGLTDVKTYLQEWYETHRAVPACRLYYFRSRKLFRIPTVKTKLLPCNPMFLSYKTQTFANCYNFSKYEFYMILNFFLQNICYLGHGFVSEETGSWHVSGHGPRYIRVTWSTNHYFSILWQFCKKKQNINK